MSWRRFNGWEPASTTTYTHDDQGRVISSTTVTEPEWDESDRALFAALIVYRNGLCRGCGDHTSETTDPRMEGRYEPDGFVQCHKCVGLEQAWEPVEKNPDSHPRRHTYRYEIKTLPPAPLQ